MEKIRIGNDFAIEWRIYQDLNGEQVEYNLVGKQLVLKCSSPFSTIEVKDFSVYGNVITWNFYGKDQKATGNYSLILEENKGKLGMVTVDVISAFALVQHTKDEHKDDNNNQVTIEKITLSSKISYGNCGGGGSIEVREIYPTKVLGLIDEDYDITEEERAYNIETLSKVVEGETIFLKKDGGTLFPTMYRSDESYSEVKFSLVVDLFGTPYSYTATITSNGDAVLETKELSTGGGGIDPELLEGYMPLVRDFSDDFNNDFTR